jgi:IS30 family transposase
MSKKKHRHLREEDRGVIYRMNKAGKTQQAIAEAIGFSQSSVSKEMARNCGQRGYRPRQAHEKAWVRKKSKKGRELLIVGRVLEEVELRLKKKHSPEQISGKLRLMGICVSHETIYSYVLDDKLCGGDLYKTLRINGKRRYRHRVKAGRTGKIPNRTGIEQRPAVVERRNRYGDWEVDLIVGAGRSGYLLSLYERRSRLGKLELLPEKNAEATAAAIIEKLRGYRVKTLTYDNGLEFAGHGLVSEALGAQGYFCQPYHSWEKGGVENFNGLVRQYFPKGSDFGEISISTLRSVEIEINERPRKILGYKSPSEQESKLAA